jgi:glutaredoxin
MIEIYGKTQCPFCDRAKALCEQKGVDYVYYQLDVDFDREKLLELFPTARTFPQIRERKIEANYDYIGGFTELEALL